MNRLERTGFICRDRAIVIESVENISGGVRLRTFRDRHHVRLVESALSVSVSSVEIVVVAIDGVENIFWE